jgi:copper chaperone
MVKTKLHCGWGYYRRCFDLPIVGSLKVTVIKNLTGVRQMIAFEVKDMTCGHCVSAITRAVKAADQDAKVAIDLASRRVQIESHHASAAELSDTIEQAGYTPEPVAATSLDIKGAAPKRGGCCG